MRGATTMTRMLGLIVAAVLAASAAWADQGTVQDSRDPDERMDPVQATHGHAEDLDGVLAHAVSAAEPWADGDLYRVVLKIWIPSTGDKWDRKIVATTNAFDDETRSSWQALVYDGKGHIRGHANAWRPDDQTFRIELSKWLLDPDIASYRWMIRVVSACQPAGEGQLCGGPKVDRVPDEGRVLHRL